MVDLNTNLNSMLLHAYHHCVYRCRHRQGPREKELPWCKEERRRRRKEEKKEEEEEAGGRGPAWPVQDLVRPDPQPGHPVPGPVNRAPNRIPCLVPEGDRKLRKFPVGARSTGPRTGPPGHRPGLTGSQTGLHGFDSTGTARVGPPLTCSTQAALYAYIST